MSSSITVGVFRSASHEPPLEAWLAKKLEDEATKVRAALSGRAIVGGNLQQVLPSGVEERADGRRRLGVAAVALVGVDLRQRLDVVADAGGDGGQGFAGVELGAGVPVAEIVQTQ